MAAMPGGGAAGAGMEVLMIIKYVREYHRFVWEALCAVTVFRASPGWMCHCSMRTTLGGDIGDTLSLRAAYLALLVRVTRT